MSDQLHVMIIARGRPTEDYPLNGIFEYDQAVALKEAGMRVTYVAFDWRSIRRRRPLGIRTEAINTMPVFVVSVPIGPLPNWFYRAVERLVVFPAIRKVFTRVGIPNVIHAHFARSGEIGLRISKKYKIPLVYTEHSSNVLSNNAKYLGLVKPTWEAAEGLIAVSKTLADAIYLICNRRPRVIGNTVESAFAEMPIAHRDAKLRFVSVGSLLPRKGHDVLVEAFSRLPAASTLEIFGEGPEREHLQRLIEQMNLEERVILRGQCGRGEIAECFSRSDCFVLASRSETFGVAYIEAMAAGLPVVATRCGGPEGFVNDDCGLLVDVDDSASLCAAMLSVGSSNSYDAHHIKESIVKQYSSKAIAAELKAIYESALVCFNS